MLLLRHVEIWRKDDMIIIIKISNNKKFCVVCKIFCKNLIRSRSEFVLMKSANKLTLYVIFCTHV